MQAPNRIQQLTNMLQDDPNDLFLNYALGLEYAVQGNGATQAEAQFLKVLQLNPAYIAAYYQLGKLHEQLQRVPEALRFYKSGLEEARRQKNNKAINEFGEAIFMLED